MRKCPKCKLKKEEEEFYPSSPTWCKSCHNKRPRKKRTDYHREWKRNRREELREYEYKERS